MSFFQTEILKKTQVVVLDRPPVNALNVEMMEEGAKLFRQIGAEMPEGGVVITGKGKSFCAGVDPQEQDPASTDTSYRLKLISAINHFAGALHRIRCPLVCAVNGHAVGAGGIMCLIADWVVATDAGGQIGIPEATTDMPFPPVPQVILNHSLDPVWRRRMALSSQLVSAEDALTVGIVDELVPHKMLLPAALTVARRMAGQPAFGEIKASLRQASKREIDTILAI